VSGAPPWFSWHGADLTLSLALQPGAKRDEFVGLHGDAVRVRIQAPPVDGKANQRLIEFLAAEFATPRSAVRIVRGESARGKVVRIASPQRLPAALAVMGLKKTISAAPIS
jgi:uncharacterized protein (TIGR00251 family)